MSNISNNLIKEYIDNAKCYLSNYFYEKTIPHRNLREVYLSENFQNTMDVSKKENYISVEDYLGELYETVLSKEQRKDFGAFYTRESRVITEMLKDKDVYGKKILEPACGSGQFAVYIVKKILYGYKKISSIEKIISIQENLYLNDIDKNATEIAEINVLSAIMPFLIEIVNNDKTFKINKIKISNFDFIDKNVFKERFDIVIGNPPYVTFYGKRSRNMTEEKRQKFNKFNFVQKKKGNNKFNLAMFFIENGLEALKKSGNLIFILDISFFETAFIDMRRYIVKNYMIYRIVKGMKEFEGVSSGQLILDLVNEYNFNNIINLIDCVNNKQYKIKQSDYDNENNKYKFYTPLNNIEQNIDDKVKKFEKLDCFFPNKALRTCCALTGRTEDFIVDSAAKNEQNVFPYVEGSKGLKEKFGRLKNDRYIKFDYDLQLKISNEFKKQLEIIGVKNKKRVTLGDKDAYVSPKIFIRQSATEIIATYTENNYAANNSIYVLTMKSRKNKDKQLLKYVCGIMNSDLISFYCRVNKIIRFENGKTPQIKTSDLKDIRIAFDDEKMMYEIIRLVEQLLVCENKKNLLKKLNNKVYKMYGIDKDEVNYINDYLKLKAS